MLGVNETLQSCVERVLQSETFRNSPSSRRLLKYLADHSTDNGAAQLKEYTIGVDAFGKPDGYDPRQDSTVRIQIGRVRQRLAEYYAAEGRDDALVIDLPRGRFRLSLEPRATVDTAVRAEAPEDRPAPPNRWRLAALVLSGLLLSMSLAGSLAVWKLSGPPRFSEAGWTPELQELWQPFLTNRPLLVAVGNPLFIQFDNKALYRDLSIEKYDDLLKSPNWSTVNQAIGSHESRPVFYYAAVGDVSAAFLLGQRLGPHQENMSVVRSTQLQWQQMADANVLFLGPPRFFGERLGSLPLALEITETPDGFRNLHPQQGEPDLFKYRDPAGFFAEDGEACVLVTRAAGPDGDTDIETFAGNSTFGRLGAVKAFTDRAFVQTLVARMRGVSGRIPRYFQVLLRVKYKGGVPTETFYLLHRELRRRQ
jgi:hypothetical protein